MGYITQAKVTISSQQITLPGIPATATVSGSIYNPSTSVDCDFTGTYSGANNIWNLSCVDTSAVPDGSATVTIETSSPASGATGAQGPKGDTGPAGPAEIGRAHV